ncbi:PKD domain-containing protein [Algoriphagus ratkowskyi]|uniref:PKD domain-containing protein n=1 Tax=Algoriphagus ratkowskyi TaxID=57028 RepID=A0A2W7RQY1_9BACT|nr:PKD domain-containing protein [Algoriphagus ratkowskyi]PZX57757.1 PKD domain-containing protein [Algoriphagus ratkowskyi]TXD79023.1 PKD domain-containing protein [Algoriphagus ratkowskyi]
MKLNYLSVSLLAIILAGCSSDDENPVIKADFEVLSDRTFAFVPVQFEAVPNSAYAYFWDFGNGKSSNEKTVYPIYEEPGTYTVSLTTTSLNKVKNTVSKEIKIGAYFITKITALPYEGYANENLSFIIEQKKEVGNVSLEQHNISSEEISTGNPFQIPTSKIYFSGANFDLGFPIFRIFESNNPNEILNSYNLGSVIKLELNEDKTFGKGFQELGFRSPYNFEFEFIYDYVD